MISAGSAFSSSSARRSASPLSQGCARISLAEMRCAGSTCSMRMTKSLASPPTRAQAGPAMLNLPSPTRCRILDGSSVGCVAKGVSLQEGGSNKRERDE